jgi:hypothetical protein
MTRHQTRKPVHSLRLSSEGLRQLKSLSMEMHRSEANVVEIALDRMYREEIRFNQLTLHEKTTIYCIEDHTEEK